MFNEIYISALKEGESILPKKKEGESKRIRLIHHISQLIYVRHTLAQNLYNYLFPETSYPLNMYI